jgi:hypothetical protein
LPSGSVLLLRYPVIPRKGTEGSAPLIADAEFQADAFMVISMMSSNWNNFLRSGPYTSRRGPFSQ